VSESTGGREAESKREPFDWREAFRSFGRELERQQRRTEELDTLLAKLGVQVELIADEQRGPKGTPTLSWLLLDDPEFAVTVLVDLAVWVETVYLRYDDAALPACWLWHPGLVDDLLTLRQGHADAFDPKSRSAAKALDWAERYRPGTVKRWAETVRDCDLSKHEQPALPRMTPLKLTVQRAAVAHAEGLTITPEPAELEEAANYQPDYSPTRHL
jgi:hypothetical protein